MIPFDAGSETLGLGGRERLYKHQRGTEGMGRDGKSQGTSISNQSHTTTSYPGPAVVSKLVCSVAVTENRRAGPKYGAVKKVGETYCKDVDATHSAD